MNPQIPASGTPLQSPVPSKPAATDIFNSPEYRAAQRTIENLPPRLRRQITPVEEKVLTLIASGLSDTKIGLCLGKSPRTVSVQAGQLLAKFDVHSRVQLLARLNVLTWETHAARVSPPSIVGSAPKPARMRLF